jgi:two-component system cell cycle sensor histidine kinase/response regulator CckA
VLFWNRASEVMSHIPRELVLGKPLDLSPLLDGKPLPSLAELLLNGTEEELLNRYGKRGTIRFDSLLGVLECRSFFVVQGEKRNIRIVASRVHDTAGVLLGVIQCIQDVTDEDRLQRQLMHAEKMQSIGTLASGMAHEFNNILAAIRGYAQLVVMKLGSEHPTMRYLHEVDVSCQRAASLTQRMLAFSRADIGKQLPIKVNELLEGVCQLLRQTMPPEIEFDLDLQRGLPFVLADPNQMEQVIINLAVNARDAIPNGGTIRLRSRLLNSAEDLADSVSADPTAAGSGPYVEIQVEDNGTGMAAEVMERVFDPFFTTKEPGKGTGLGLYIVYSILKSHRGWVKPESAVGQGTRFRLFLPVLEDPAVKVPAPYPPEEREKLCGQGESVLVVEDEAPLRGLLQETLTAHGYGVTLAEDGVQAIQQCQRAIDGRAPFDVVVLDLAMPVMRGEDCLHHLLDLDPCLRVLLISGLPDEIPQATLHRHALLRKPFQLQAFLGELRTVLVQD